MLSHPAVIAISQSLHGRSVVLLERLERRLPQVLIGWLALVALASLGRLTASPLVRAHFDLSAVVPYLLLTTAPVATLLLALRWFADGDAMPQPQTRLAVIGRWRSVSPAAAQEHPLYGTTGIMVSLLIGMLLNVPVRAAEYFVTMPAISAAAPEWLSTLHFLMTVDVVVMSSLYVVCFAAALRRVPLFPRLLVAVWMIDLLMQLVIAHGAVQAGLPPAVASALHALLEGNLTKVMISIGLWLPYLLLSTRVNVTYRQRFPA